MFRGRAGRRRQRSSVLYRRGRKRVAGAPRSAHLKYKGHFPIGKCPLCLRRYCALQKSRKQPFAIRMDSIPSQAPPPWRGRWGRVKFENAPCGRKNSLCIPSDGRGSQNGFDAAIQKKRKPRMRSCRNPLFPLQPKTTNLIEPFETSGSKITPFFDPCKNLIRNFQNF